MVKQKQGIDVSDPPQSTPIEAGIDLNDPEYYLNRELSWLEFAKRVFDEALDHENPLLERVKFISIVSSILDEYFMVRVAGLVEQRIAGISRLGPDQLTAVDQLAVVEGEPA